MLLASTSTRRFEGVDVVVWRFVVRVVSTKPAVMFECRMKEDLYRHVVLHKTHALHVVLYQHFNFKNNDCTVCSKCSCRSLDIRTVHNYI